MKKNRVEVNLIHKETGDKIKITAPAKITMGIFQTFYEIRYGLPPFDVKPFDIKGLIKQAIVFLAIIVSASMIYDESTGMSLSVLIIGLSLFAYFYYINRFYYRDYIRSKLAKGYVAESENDSLILEQTNTVYKYQNSKENAQ